jgi:Inner membrane component of T3SS, cytoplasmic domain/Protein of unknown function (DUF3662)
VLKRTRRNGIRPIEIGRQVVANMDDQAEANSGQVAHRYVVGLHKSDLAALSDALKPLMSELRQAVTNHAQFEGYSLSGDAEVVFEEDVAMRSGSCVVTIPKTITAELPVQYSTPSAHKYVVVLPDGSKHALDGDLVTIGRQDSCTIVIHDHNISRVHARLRPEGDGWTIEDLGSTNGTRVAGLLIAEPTAIVGGQMIALGSLQLHFERA